MFTPDQLENLVPIAISKVSRTDWVPLSISDLRNRITEISRAAPDWTELLDAVAALEANGRMQMQKWQGPSGSAIRVPYDPLRSREQRCRSTYFCRGSFQLRLTHEGRKMLEQGKPTEPTAFPDELGLALRKLDPRLVEMRDGASAALLSRRPDSLRQAAHSARELIEQALNYAAPDAEVKAQPDFVPDTTSKTGVTRRMRLRRAMEKRGGCLSDNDLKVADAACALVLAVDDKLQALAHSRPRPREEDVRSALEAAEIALRLTLVPHQAET
jgi:hypothetical protein